MTATADPSGPDRITESEEHAPAGHHLVRRPVPRVALAGQAQEPAPFWRRLCAWFLDMVIVNVAVGAFSSLPEEALAVVAILWTPAYFTVAHGVWGITPGKAALSIRVRAVEADRPIGLWRAMLRLWSTFVSAGVLLLGYLWMLWDPARQTWHDKFADSLVVRNR